MMLKRGQKAAGGGAGVGAREGVDAGVRQGAGAAVREGTTQEGPGAGAALLQAKKEVCSVTVTECMACVR